MNEVCQEEIFQLGDRVEVVGPSFLRGEVGTVMSGGTSHFFIGVRFDRSRSQFHTLGGICDHYHGYWLRGDDLRLISEKVDSLFQETSEMDMYMSSLM